MLVWLGRFGMVGFVGQVWFGQFGLEGLVWQVWSGRFALVGLVLSVWFGGFGLVGLVWQVWFGLVKEDDLKGPLVPLKVAKSRSASWNYPGSGWVGCWVGSNSYYKAISVQLQQQVSIGTELGKNITW